MKSKMLPDVTSKAVTILPPGKGPEVENVVLPKVAAGATRLVPEVVRPELTAVLEVKPVSEKLSKASLIPKTP